MISPQQERHAGPHSRRPELAVGPGQAARELKTTFQEVALIIAIGLLDSSRRARGARGGGGAVYIRTY
eukprot:SAG31_NODE_74_length_27628_cov_18.235642_1_plen_68_part_00